MRIGAVKDAVLMQRFSRDLAYTFAEDALEKWPQRWVLRSMNRWLHE